MKTRQIRLRSHRRGDRQAAAAVEVVMATAASFVMMVPMLILAVRALRNLNHIVQTLVGWPYL